MFVAHSIEIWRAVLSMTETPLALGQSAADDELSSAEETDTPVVELSRQYPDLPRAIAEYLAR
jgi:hypothetical protein